MSDFDNDEVCAAPAKLDFSVQTKPMTCETHGDYTSKGMFGGKVWTLCPECSKISAAVEKEKAEAKEKAENTQRWERKLGHACIPDRYRDRRFENYIAKTKGQQHALAVTQEYAENFLTVNGRSLILSGLPGTGKTHLANAICLHIMEHHKSSAMFTTVMKAIRRIKDTWGKGSEESETQAIEAFVWPDLLVLDEIGVQFGSETEKMLLFDILNERYEQRKPTVLISNLPVKDVIGYLGERIFDRMKEDNGISITFTWPSHRGTPC